MTPIFPELPHPLGDYTLTALLDSRGESELYVASQGSVGRTVVLEVLRAGAAPEQQGLFLQTARHRVAASGLPHVGQVYESLCAGGLWFLTQELPQGEALSQQMQAGQIFTIIGLCRILSAAADVYVRCAEAGHAARPFTAADIFLQKSGSVSFLSPVVAAPVAADTTAQQQGMAALIAPLIPQGAPGCTRLTSVLQWMLYGYEGATLGWDQIGESARTILHQLGADEAPAATEQTSEAGKRRRRRRALRHILMGAGYALAALALTLGIGSIGFFFRGSKTVSLPAVRAEGFTCRTDDGQLAIIDPHPVSIAAYADFLQDWEQAPEEERQRCLKHIPESERPATLQPAHWENQLQASDKNAPVTGVSYHQAAIVAAFRGSSLPSALRLQAVFSLSSEASGAEWSSDSFSGDGCGLIPAGAPLGVSRTEPFAPLALPNRSHSAGDLTFRLLTPIPQPTE